jgi:hypothetical protein
MKRLKIRVVYSDGQYWYIAHVSDSPDWKYILFPVRLGTPWLAMSLALSKVTG